MASNRVTLTRAEAAAIVREGAAAAAREGVTALDCPYKPNGDANERLRTAAWMRGFIRAAGTRT